MCHCFIYHDHHDDCLFQWWNFVSPIVLTFVCFHNLVSFLIHSFGLELEVSAPPRSLSFIWIASPYFKFHSYSLGYISLFPKFNLKSVSLILSSILTEFHISFPFAFLGDYIQDDFCSWQWIRIDVIWG